MDGKSALRHVVDNAGLSQRQISQAIGRTPNYLGSVLTKGSTPGTDVLAEVAGACGYSLVLRGHGEELTIDGRG